MASEYELAGLIEWQQTFAKKQTDLIKWQEGITQSIESLQSACQTILEGCQVLMKANTMLVTRCEDLKERLDIANKRIRRLESKVLSTAVTRILPR